MKSLGHLFLGILTAAGSGLLVVAAISLALVEGGTGRANVPTTAPSLTATIAAILTPAGGVTLQPTATQVITTAPDTYKCSQTPPDWVKYTVQSGEDLSAIAARVGVTAEKLMEKNCMKSATLEPGWILSVPFIPTETATLTEVPPTPTTCGPLPGWVYFYTVQPGDTLLRLSLAMRVTVADIQRANCLPDTTIRAGTQLRVPSIPRLPSTSTPAPQPSDTATLEPTVSETVITITAPTETATDTATPESTFTETPAPSSTATSTSTPAPTATVTPTSGSGAPGTEITVTVEAPQTPTK